MSQTFEAFKDDIKSLVFPGGFARTLEFQFEQDVLQALIYIQRWVAYYRKRNRTVIPFCSTYFNCGATVFELPRGRIQRLFTIQAKCCPVWYDFIDDYDTFQNWLIYNRIPWTDPANAGMPVLQSPFKFSESSTDKGRRYNFGKWTIHNNRIYVGHRIESTESIVTEWEGIKRKYDAGDLMPYDDPEEGDENDRGTELKVAVASYVRSEDLRKNRHMHAEAADERRHFDFLVAEMKYEDRAETKPKIQPEKEYDQLVVAGTSLTGDSCADPECQTEESAQTGCFAIIGDWGNPANEANMLAVEALVDGWNPDFIITSGDNRYGNYTFAQLFAIATAYKAFVDDGLFFPAVGNHDTDDDGGIADYLAMFDYLPNGGRNYDIILGNVHFFFRETHDAGSNVPSAADLAASAAWLQQRLAASQAVWKIVITQDPPYVSDAGNGNGHAASQLDYAGWGADAVISGDSHFYERLLKNGIPHIVNGVGGTFLDTPDAPIAGSVIQSSSYGAIKGCETCEAGVHTLTLTFINVAEEEVDEIELEKTL